MYKQHLQCCCLAVCLRRESRDKAAEYCDNRETYQTKLYLSTDVVNKKSKRWLQNTANNP